MSTILSAGNRALKFRVLVAPDQELAPTQLGPRGRADFVSGVRSGVNGTPTFFINGRRHDGTYTFDDLAAAVDAHLNSTISPV